MFKRVPSKITAGHDETEHGAQVSYIPVDGGLRRISPAIVILDSGEI